MVANRLNLDASILSGFCHRWRIKEFALFGSVLRDDFGPESDVDCLVVFDPQATWTLLDVIGAEEELSRLIGRPADLVEKQVVEQSGNWIRRRAILSTAETLYVE